MSDRPLFIFEMANNHQGSVEHGRRIIREIRNVCDSYPEFDYAFKFQYRDLDSFIHPDYKDRMDIKNIKRFQDTRLNMEQFAELLAELRACGFKAICTPFDEVSVDNIVKQEYDYIKIASCSFTDWPLLEKIATAGLPVIASGAGSGMDDVCRVVNFFVNRNINLSLMHCVAEYPTPNDRLQLNQIDYYRAAFPNIRIGFSTHEDPDNIMPVRLAVAKGAKIFEKHVGVPTEDITLNAYSADPGQVAKWLAAAREAYSICGLEGRRYESTDKEQADLAALRRGVFVKNGLKAGDTVSSDNVFLAFPCSPGQLTARDLSKYNVIKLRKDITSANAPVMESDIEEKDDSQTVLEIMKNLVTLLSESKVVVPTGSVCEISHHYGLENYDKTGVAMIDCVNREYCKKILAVLKGQSHPDHYHLKKEETFVVLHGELNMVINGETKVLHKGDLMTIERGMKHSFSSDTGCIFEEISSTHYVNDSYYDDEDNFVRPRKTKVHFTKDMMNRINGQI